MAATLKSEHPDQQRLLNYLEGTITGNDSEELGDHLKQCPTCQQRLEKLENEQTESQKKTTLASIRNSLGSVDPTLVHIDRENVGQVSLAPTFDAIPLRDLPKVLTGTTPNTQAEVDTAAPVSSTPTATFIHSSGTARSMDLGTHLGPYLLEAKLGEGGMGAVYQARHTKLDKTVALKVLSEQFTKNPNSVLRFEREMKAVGKLDHPQIVRAMDAGQIDGIHYLAMEYVDGTDLQALVRSRGPLSVVNACKAIRQASQALAAAHAAGLVHRDIKPANLILAKNGQMKVLDLGLALLGDDSGQNTELTTAGQTFGTPDYMAPEQWENTHTSDGRVDLYALGCTLFFLLTGRAPYATENCKTFVAKMKAHVTAPIPDLKAARKDVPDGVVAVYRTLMAKLPEDRFQNASELAAALLPLSSTKQMAPQPVSAAPVTVAPSMDATLTDTETHSELPNLDLPKTPPADSLFINSETFSKPGTLNPLRNPQTRLSPKTASSGKNIVPKKIFLACGGAFAAFLFGIIVINIRNQDGSETVIKIPKGSTIELKTDPSSKVTISQQDNVAMSAIPPRQEAFKNSIGMEFLKVPKGTGWLGGELGQQGNTKVDIEQDFFLGKYEVTQEEWEAVTGLAPSHFSRNGPGADSVKDISDADLKRFPLELVSWEDCQLFIERLNKKEKDTGRVYRLPKEEEWEYACRGGPGDKLDKAFDFYFSKPTNILLPDQATFGFPKAFKRTTKVGSYSPNKLGLHDMHGNVWEWCDDSEKTAEGASYRVLRGGCWNSNALDCRAAYRDTIAPASRSNSGGFRLALSAAEVSEPADQGKSK